MKKIQIKIDHKLHCSESYSITYHDIDYKLVFDGELYNQSELYHELKKEYPLKNTPEEIIFYLYLKYDIDAYKYLEGAYFYLINHHQDSIIVKDPLGLYPIYYTKVNDCYYISNHLATLLSISNRYPQITRQGILQLFAMGPSTHLHDTLFNGIFSLPMGNYIKITQANHKVITYYQIPTKPHKDDLETSAHKIKELLTHSIQQQMNDCNASFLSGGLDSSIISGIASKKANWKTYSLEYEGNDLFFKGNDYQVSLDTSYINQMVDAFSLDHKVLTVKNKQLINLLNEALLIRGLPGMADIDSSLLWLNKQISCDHKIILSGECSDEFFGGYPWFYKDELKSNHFPWLRNIDKRIKLLHPNYQNLDYENYLIKQHDDLVNKITFLDSDTNEDINTRIQTNLVIHYFMQCLVTRQNVISDASNLTIRAPFANVKLLEYVYNIPWKMKYYHQQEKGLLRKAFEQVLPLDVLYRKKNPFPKTHHPYYATLISELLLKRYHDPSSVLHQLFDDIQLLNCIKSKGASFPLPWYGQLMSGPQLLAYIYQIDQWFELFHVEIID